VPLSCSTYIPTGQRNGFQTKHLHMSKLLTACNNPRLISTLIPSAKMPAFTLYGARGSTNTDRVRLTLAEGGFTDYQLVLLNLQKGEQKVSRISRRKNLNTFPHVSSPKVDR
jgi:hypothetical protein